MSQTKAQLVDGKSATIQFTGGTAAVPSVTFTGDLDTGIYSPGANQVAISTGGIERLLLTGGNVAIGVASPSAKLHISGSFWATNGELAGGNTASTGTDGTFRLLSSGGINYFQFGQNRTGGSTAPLVFGSIFGAAEYMRITSDGKLGLGTSSPQGLFSLTSAGTSTQLTVQTVAGANDIIKFDTYNASAIKGIYTWYQQNTEVMRLDASGRLGVGTTSPSELLHVSGPGSATVRVASTDTSGGAVSRFRAVFLNGGTGGANNALDLRAGFEYCYLVAEANVPLLFGTNNTERARIDSSGRLLVGTSSSLGTTAKAIEAAQNIAISTFANNAFGYELTFNKSRGSANGTIVQNGDTVGNIVWRADDGTDTDTPVAQISAAVDGTPGANDMPGRLVFSTTFDGQSSPTERMRIDSSGRVLISTTSSFDNTAYVQSTSTSGATTAFAAKITNSSTASVFSCNNSSNTYVGGINVSSAATAFVTSSDYRLKENVVRVTDGITRLQQLKPSRFNFIAEPARTVDGFLAHEVQSVVPEAIFGKKDAVDEKGDPVYQSIDQAKLVPLLTAALQEAVARIEQLETAVATLQGA